MFEPFSEDQGHRLGTSYYQEEDIVRIRTFDLLRNASATNLTELLPRRDGTKNLRTYMPSLTKKKH